jgi:hypothetical protein
MKSVLTGLVGAPEKTAKAIRSVNALAAGLAGRKSADVVALKRGG